MHALRQPSEREDDARDERITVIDYARPLIDNFLSPGTDAKYITTIDPSDVHSSPNTLQAILGEHGNQKLRDGRRDAHIFLGCADVMPLGVFIYSAHPSQWGCRP